MQAESTVKINRPARDVFAFLSQPENHPRFVPGVHEFHVTSGTMAEGASAIGTRRVMGMVRRLPYRITLFEPNRVLSMTTQLGPLQGGATYYLESEGDSATQVRFVVQGGFRGLLRVADRLLARTLAKDAAAVGRNLKALLDGDQPATIASVGGSALDLDGGSSASDRR
jgi:carbon monoxide dehydrogenase subunit G